MHGRLTMADNPFPKICEDHKFIYDGRLKMCPKCEVNNG